MTFDPKKPHGIVCGPHGGVFEQAGRIYDADHNDVTDVAADPEVNEDGSVAQTDTADAAKPVAAKRAAKVVAPKASAKGKKTAQPSPPPVPDNTTPEQQSQIDAQLGEGGGE